MTRNPTDYRETDHDNVYAHESETVTESAQAEATRIARALDTAVYVSMGPYRFHDVKYDAAGYDPTAEPGPDNRVMLDYYSVRPGYQHTDRIIEDIRAETDQPEASA